MGCAAVQTYSNVGDFSQYFSQKYVWGFQTAGFNSSEAVYYNKLRSLWLELYHYQHFRMESVIDNVKLAKIVDQERKKLFLAGLNPELDQIRGQIIGQKSLLSLRDVYA